MKQLSIFFNILFLIISGNAAAQISDSKFKEIFGKADGAVYDGNFIASLPLLEELYSNDSTNAHINYLLGVTYLNTRGKLNEAIDLLEKATLNVKLDHKDGDAKDKTAPGLTYYYLAKAYHNNYQFDEAITNYFNYRSFISMDNYSEYADVKHQIEAAENGKVLLETPVKVNIKNLGATINSKWDDFSPVISPDGNTLIFTSRREGSVGGKLTREGKYYDDIYITKKSDNKWSAPKSIGANVNSAGHEAATGISMDGKQLLVYKDENGDGNMYFSNLLGETWSPLVKFGPTINTKSWETHASLSSDGSTLYFTSNKPGGVGGRDIYYSKKLPNGDWGVAKNLGKSVNSPYDEDAPYISTDGKTLFFSSRGHVGMGGFDIMFCEKNDTGWGDVQNIGYPINSPENDVFYVATADGKTAYYSSQRTDGYGGLDIYKLSFGAAEEKPEPTVAVLKGKVIISDTQKAPQNANIVVTNKATKDLVGVFKPSATDGSYLVSLQTGNTYIISYENDGYLQSKEEVTFKLESGFQEIEKDVTLKKVSGALASAENKAISENRVVDKVEQTETGKSETEYSVQTDYSKYMKQQGKEDLAVKTETKPEETEADAALRRRKQELLDEIERMKSNKSSASNLKQENPDGGKLEAQKAELEIAEQKKAQAEKEKNDAIAAEAEARKVKELEKQKHAQQKAEEQKALEEEKNRIAKFKAEQEEQKKIAARQKAQEQEEARKKLAEPKVEEKKPVGEADVASAMTKLEAKKEAEATSKQEYELLQQQANEAKAIAAKKAKEAAAAQKAVQAANQQANNAKAIVILKEKKAAEARAVANAKAKSAAALKAKEAATQKELEVKSAQLEAENAIKLAKLGVKDGEEISDAILKAEATLRSKVNEENNALAQLRAKEEEIKQLKAETERLKTERAKAAAETKALEEIKLKEEKRIKLEEEAKAKEEAQRTLAANLKAENDARNAQIAEERRVAQEKAEEERRKAAELRAAARLAAKEKAIADSIAKIQQKLAYEAKVKADQEKKEKEQYELRVQYESGEANKTIQTQKKRIGELENDNRLLREELRELAGKVEFLTKELDFQKNRLAENQKKSSQIIEKLTELSTDYADEDDYSSLRNGKKIILKNIYFDYDKSFLRRESFAELNKIYNYLVAHNDLNIEIGGHTDSKGNDAYNEQLSKDRATAVMQHLTAKGINGKRLRAVGYGKKEPIAPNENPDGSDSPEGRQKNRRIELKIFK
jgi:outer membrane protein OmpA-like peptidoglycan-associated protein